MILVFFWGGSAYLSVYLSGFGDVGDVNQDHLSAVAAVGGVDDDASAYIVPVCRKSTAWSRFADTQRESHRASSTTSGHQRLKPQGSFGLLGGFEQFPPGLIGKPVAHRMLELVI
jgi:hypothetical protein